ncbi:hypothetical protein [Geomonas edaphica]|uniref:hypothetical protein n=1 Tax=Geomonas edaphica TaxID=2570226 RepID=UPI0010A8108C|nr:hypothetical protein [Geomonas edaphica]
METDESTAVLTWPSRVENVAVLHALSQLIQIAAETNAPDTREVFSFCSYFWPWKQNTDIAQKRILVDRKEFVEGNLRCLNGCFDSKKDLNFEFHMALNRVKDLNPEAHIKQTFGGGHHSILPRHPELTHPTLYEITPQATFQPGFVKHLPLANQGFLKRAQRYISASLTDGPLLQIESAIFFMLGIPSSYRKRDLTRGDLFSARRPDVVLLDLYNPYSRIGKDWQKQLAELLSALTKAFSGHERGTPPLLALTEDPTIFNRLHLKTLADYEEQRRQKRHVSQYSFLNVVQSIFDDKEKVADGSPIPSVMVAPFAEEMADVFTAGQELRNKVKDLGSEELADQIDALNQTVRNAVNLPGGFDDYMNFLEEYCDQSGRDVKTVAIKPVEEWTKTKELVEMAEAGAERFEAETFLKNTRTIIDGLKKSTPLQSRLEVVYQKLLSHPEISHAVVFPSKPVKAFAEWMIANRLKHITNGNGNGDAKLVLFDARQALDLSTTLLTETKKVYFVLPRQKYLSPLIAQTVMPPDITFLCDAGTVLSLIHYVGILEKVPGLGVIKPRLLAMREALERAAGSRISLLGELDEVKMIANAFIYNLREIEHGQFQGHPVIIVTDDSAQVSAYEGSEILLYQEENDLQPFSKVQVSQLKSGDRFFVITSEFLDAASDKINITAMASETLKAYHARVVEKVRGIRGSMREKAEAIQRRMQCDARGADIGEGENVGNIVRWINVEGLLEMPRDLVKPNAPKIRKVFKLFMKALGVSDGEIDWYWAAAIQSTRKVRIRAGLDRNRVFYKLLLDPASVKQFFHGDETDLLNLIDIACRNVFTVAYIIREHENGNTEH